MKIKIIRVCAVALLTVMATACQDFLEESSQNMAYADNVEDLDELLIGECYWQGGNSLDSTDAANASMMHWSALHGAPETKPYFPYIHVMDDDVTESLNGSMGDAEKNYIRMKASHLHTWQPDPFLDINLNEIEDYNWRVCYRRIAVVNSILSQLDEMRGDEPDQELCNRVEGEAHFLRAQYYFWLANLYARPYCKATAQSDKCIPLKTTEEVEDKLFERDPMEAVYGQIVKDLEQATVSLRGILQASKEKGMYRANQAAAFALLSRVHLYMENYEQAITCADSVLNASEYSLLEFNWHVTGTSAVYAKSPETIFTHGPNLMQIIHAQPIKKAVDGAIIPMVSAYISSADLMECIDKYEGDLRKRVFFRNVADFGFRCVKVRYKDEEVSDIMAIRLPEVYLNKAEAQALLGLDAEARATIHELRAKRFSAADLQDFTSAGEELVNEIRDERRRELCYEGHRWFDLRRYAVNSVYPFTKSIRHQSLAYEAGVGTYVRAEYELKPYNEDVAAYMLPIPRFAIEFNEGMLTNEIRNQREPISK